MGFADPRLGSYVMTCCGASVPWMPGKPGGRWRGNTSWEVEKCPNEYCLTNRKEPIKWWSANEDQSGTSTSTQII